MHFTAPAKVANGDVYKRQLLDYFRGRSFEGLSSVKRGLDGREAVRAVEVATGCDLDLFEDFWLGSPGETDVHVGPYVKRDLIALSYICLLYTSSSLKGYVNGIVKTAAPLIKQMRGGYRAAFERHRREVIPLSLIHI